MTASKKIRQLHDVTALDGTELVAVVLQSGGPSDRKATTRQIADLVAAPPVPSPPNAVDVPYDNDDSGLAATNVQTAIDEIAAGGSATSYETKPDVETSTIAGTIDYLRIAGYAAAGDGGGALYARAASEPAHEGKIQSDDGAWWELADDRLDVRMLGAVVDGTTADEGALAAAIGVAEALGYAFIEVPAGRLRLAATTPIAANSIRLRGAGEFTTEIYRDFATGPTLDFNATSNDVLYGCGVYDMRFLRNTAVALDASNVAHIKAVGCLQFGVDGVRGDDVVEGIDIVGGARIALGRVNFVGDYTAADKARFGVKTSKLASPGSGATALPSYVDFGQVWCSGAQISGFGYPLWITAGEKINIGSRSYFGQGKFFSVLIEQGTDNALILDVTFEPGSYIDGADKSVAGDGIYITGSGVLSGETWDASARTGGNGSGYIGNTRLLGTIKGQNGDGRDGVRVNGTGRGGTYDQAVRGMRIAGGEISAWARNGANLLGGVDVEVLGCLVRGNNYANALAGSGIVLGANLTRPVVLGNRIGGDAFGLATSAFQVYPVDIISGCADYTVAANNCALNVNHIRASSANGLLLNNPDGGLSTIHDAVAEMAGDVVGLARKSATGLPAALVRPAAGTPANYVQLIGIETAGAPRVVATGSDTDIDLSLEPQGGGVVRQTRAAAAPAYREVTAAGAITVAVRDVIIGVNKSVGAATSVNLGLAADRLGVPVTIKDVKGDADSNNITPVLSGGELIDGQTGATWAIISPYGTLKLYPRTGGWYTAP